MGENGQRGPAGSLPLITAGSPLFLFEEGSSPPLLQSMQFITAADLNMECRYPKEEERERERGFKGGCRCHHRCLEEEEREKERGVSQGVAAAIAVA
uniref:Uncharacterized protein n=1 Tax=Nelumbo nucifera TaxID=4432 RepID=A0A822Y437_NELNU|nr:TPA_asm: hypothetical protein HUJ06_028500 [Nelumbo nucifera]